MREKSKRSRRIFFLEKKCRTKEKGAPELHHGRQRPYFSYPPTQSTPRSTWPHASVYHPLSRYRSEEKERKRQKGKLVKSPPFTDGYWNVVLAKVVLFVSRAETGGESNVSCA